MPPLSAILSILGLICDAVASSILLPRIFITDDELRLLAELPLEPSTSHMTGELSGKTLPVAVTDVASLSKYRSRYIDARKNERRNGRYGLGLLVAGSILQVVGIVVTLG